MSQSTGIEEDGHISDSISELSDGSNNLNSNIFYTGLFGIFVVVSTDRLFDLVLGICARIKSPEKH